MSAEECALSDWHAVGFEDGSLGYAAARLGDHRRACAEHGYAPDFAAYQAGREEGLRLYCQPSRGFNVGSKGGQYNGVCGAESGWVPVSAVSPSLLVSQIEVARQELSEARPPILPSPKLEARRHAPTPTAAEGRDR